MKKLCAIVLALALALSAVPALAAELNWSDVEEYAAQIDGRFVLIEQVGAIMWLPDIMQQVELPEEAAEMGYIGAFATDDGSYAVAIQYMDAQGADLSALIPVMEESGATGFEDLVINGIPGLGFDMEAADSSCVAIATEQGYYLIITFSHVSDTEFAQVCQIMAASLQPAE